MAARQHRSQVLDDLGEACEAGDWPKMRTLIDAAKRYGTRDQWLLRVEELRRVVGDTQHHGADVDRVRQALTALRLHNY